MASECFGSLRDKGVLINERIDGLSRFMTWVTIERKDYYGLNLCRAT